MQWQCRLLMQLLFYPASETCCDDRGTRTLLALRSTEVQIRTAEERSSFFSSLARRLSAAIERYKMAAAANPTDARALMNAAVVLADERRLTEAVPLFRQASLSTPDAPLCVCVFG